ncbi:MAG TPA: CoA pyrophosphatase [Bacteroidia bacterium]|nr:CoA pyrophosphatase [Bacteroidia bacterium]MBX3105224.1 CoA pyrophosphatase [Bacteroidota bacterium]MCE7955746.1 CoA pyrophosphatase [Bacteroidetes bacterium CHB6]OQB65763.1 MAG: putative NUDIX hydrolase [Bacteroidetes bacterium ADurb.Bin141]MBV6453287.1 putative Nudix hydrolase NudL [Bacteroidia bacterium]
MQLQHDFKSLKNFLVDRMQLPLPGQQAQLRMVPPYRSIHLPETGFKKSSVCLLIKSKNNDPHIVMIERTDDGKVHSGQIAFPGGKMETDETIYQTALRELEEETGLSSAIPEIAGSLTPLYIPPSNFMVYPVVGFLNSDLEFSPNISEVKRILEIPLSSFFVPEIIDAHAKHTSVRGIVTSPAYCVGGVVIWGASAMILSEFLALFEKS